jgi:hypothetical protein
MRNTANFHPEWGYLAPAPSFMRTARAVLVATAIGVTLGAGVVFSWTSHQAPEPSVGERTLVRSAEAASALPQTPVQATKADGWSATERRSLADNSRSADRAANEPAAASTTRAPAGIAALTAAPTATEGRSAVAIAAPAAAAKDATLNVAPNKKKAVKKPNATWRFASRDESFGFAPGDYSRRRSWGGYYGDGGRRYENW